MGRENVANAIADSGLVDWEEVDCYTASLSCQRSSIRSNRPQMSHIPELTSRDFSTITPTRFIAASPLRSMWTVSTECVLYPRASWSEMWVKMRSVGTIPGRGRIRVTTTSGMIDDGVKKTMGARVGC